MGAYNWLRTELECYQCRIQFQVALQVHIGWCRWQELQLGDRVPWMTERDRTHAEASRCELGYELAALVEIGSSNWRNLIVSSGAEDCPDCNARGAALVVIKDNVFDQVLFLPKRVPYGTIYHGDELSTFLVEMYLPDDNLAGYWGTAFDRTS